MPSAVPWEIVYYDPPDPADSPIAFLEACPTKVQAHMAAVLDSVAAAPPPQFSGGGYWEAMHGEMGGYFEVRAQGPKREQFRLFCILDRPRDEAERAATGLPSPCIAVLTGRRKRWQTTFTAAEYAHIQALGAQYRGTFPRRIVS